MSAQRKIAWQEQDGAHVEDDAYYHRQWRAYAFRHALALIFLGLWVPVSVGLFWWSRLISHQPIAALLAMFLWLAATIGLVYWAGEFRCPRCRRRYGALGHRNASNLTRGLFDKICSNCKLRKFERLT